ncbi:MAG TPA: hypothetical protein VK158_05995 [Acidobacteriota bacterium]|nr:hypothetical protein [Acidobacteriota bacterium]
MEYTVEDLVAALTYGQLLKLQFDLNHGSLYAKKLISKRITELETVPRKICATCNCELPEQADYAYTITFGPNDFKKKATCCGMDCLEQFMGKLKQFEGIRTN